MLLPHQPHPALAALLAHRHGTLLVDELTQPVRYVIDGRAGDLVLTVPRHAFEASQWVLHVPDESERSLQALLEPTPLDESARGYAADRHAACHGPPDQPCWAAASISSARLGADVVEQESIDLRNPLFEAEPALCRALNSDRQALAHACRRLRSIDAQQPLAVSVDPWGVVLRACFGVVRLPFDAPAADQAAARGAIDRLLGAG